MKNLLSILTLFCAAFSAPAQTYRAVAVDTNGVIFAPANFIATNNLVTVIGTPSDTQVVAWDAAQTNHVYTSAGSGTLTGLTVSGGLLTGGGTSGVVNVSLATNEVLAATAATYQPITNAVTAASNFGAAGRLLIAGGNDKTATASGLLTVSNNGNISTITSAEELNLLTTTGDLNLTSSDGFLNLVGPSGVYANSVALRQDISVSIPAAAFTGPLKTDTVGWDWLQVDTAGSTFMAQGFKTASTTQAAGTMSATFMVPPSATAWATTGALQIVLIAESVTTTDCKFDVTVLRHDAAMINRTSVYSSTNNAFASTTVPTVFSVNAASFSGAPTAAGYVTVDIRLHTRNNLGAYASAAAVRFAQ